jgi:hypothetical protein
MRAHVWPTAVLVQTMAEMQLTEASACADVCSAAKILTIQLQQHKRKLRSISEKKKQYGRWFAASLHCVTPMKYRLQHILLDTEVTLTLRRKICAHNYIDGMQTN